MGSGTGDAAGDAVRNTKGGIGVKRFKADRETGITIRTFDGVTIRIDAGQEYATDIEREIEILSSTAGVIEVKEAKQHASSKTKAKD
jgi:hypothetical protein